MPPKSLGTQGLFKNTSSLPQPEFDAEPNQPAANLQGNSATPATVDMDPWRTQIQTATLQFGEFEAWTRTMQTGLKYDMLIKGGTVIDPDQRLHGVMDVAVKNGKIFKIAPDIPPEPGSRIISAQGKIVTPGFIDIHVHCYYGVAFGVNAEHYCVGRGTTTVVEAGSTGYLGINQFVKDVASAPPSLVSTPWCTSSRWETRLRSRASAGRHEEYKPAMDGDGGGSEQTGRRRN